MQLLYQLAVTFLELLKINDVNFKPSLLTETYLPFPVHPLRIECNAFFLRQVLVVFPPLFHNVMIQNLKLFITFQHVLMFRVNFIATVLIKDDPHADTICVWILLRILWSDCQYIHHYLVIFVISLHLQNGRFSVESRLLPSAGAVGLTVTQLSVQGRRPGASAGTFRATPVGRRAMKWILSVSPSVTGPRLKHLGEE